MQDIQTAEEIIKDKRVFFTTEQLVAYYSPIFTRKNVTKAITYMGLPYFQMGRKRYFDKDKIELWLEKQTDIARGRSYSSLSNLKY